MHARPAEAKTMATVIIDPGHGGDVDVEGSSANRSVGRRGTKEKLLALDIGRRLAGRMEAAGHRVALTRTGDTNVSAADRAALARDARADAFVSIHFNASPDPRVQGTEVLLGGTRGAAPDARSRRLAQGIRDQIVRSLSLPDRGLKLGNWFVLDESLHDPETARCIVEVCYLTDPSEEARLGDDAYRARIADALARGVEQGLPSSSDRGRLGAPNPAAPPLAVASFPLGFDIYESNTKSNGKPLDDADFSALRAAGKLFGIAKLGQGRADGQFAAYYEAIRRAGMIRGSYYFMTTRPIERELELIASLVPRLLPGDLAPALDLEDSDKYGYPLNKHYHYQDTSAGKAALLRAVGDLMNGIEARLGRVPIMYTGVVWRDYLRSLELSEYPLWTAHKAKGADTGQVFGGWTDWTIWQYAEDGSSYWGQAKYHEPGVRVGGIDLNAFNGTEYGLRGMADIGRVGAAATGAGTLYLAHAETDDHLHLLTGAGGSWSRADLTDAGIGRPGRDPVLFATDGDLHLFCRSGDALIAAHAGAGSDWGWEVTDLSFLAGAAPLHEPRAARGGGGALHVVYWGDDDDWHLLSCDGGVWSGGALLRDAHAGSASGQPVVFADGADACVVGRIDDQGHLLEARRTAGGATAVVDLTAAAGCPAATYSPSTYALGGTTFVVYRAVGGSLWQIARPPGGGATVNGAVDLGGAAGAVHAAGHPSAFVRDGVPHIVYRGVDQLVYDLSSDGSGWRAEVIGDAPAAADPTAAAGAENDALVSYRHRDGGIVVCRHDGIRWTSEVVAATAPPAAAGASALRASYGHRGLAHAPRDLRAHTPSRSRPSPLPHAHAQRRPRRPSSAGLQAPDWCQIRFGIIKSADEEQGFWLDAAGKLMTESNAAVLEMLEKYWRDGARVTDWKHRAERSAADDVDFPWSAAFVSWVVTNAGVPDGVGFDFSERHITYIVGALRNREGNHADRPFWLYAPDEAAVVPGDIVCRNRKVNGVWTTHSYASLKRDFWDNGHDKVVPMGSSHSDVAIAYADIAGQRTIEVIGGNADDTTQSPNVSNTVGGKRLDVDQSGFLTSPGRVFGIIKLTECPEG
jgi:N-acetylmuramoyl-L-alanine amidase